MHKQEPVHSYNISILLNRTTQSSCPQPRTMSDTGELGHNVNNSVLIYLDLSGK